MIIRDGDVDDHEYPDEDDAGDDGTIPCPHCREPVYEYAEQCPECGAYLSREDAPYQRKPVWLIVGFLLCMVVLLRWILCH